MPSSSEIKKIDPNWEKKDPNISLMYVEGNLMSVDNEILSCNEALVNAGLGGISYSSSRKNEIINRINALEILVEYVAKIRSALQQQLDDPLFEGFNKRATETLSRIHPEDFHTANTLGLTVTVTASGHGESYSSQQKKEYLDLCDFLGYTGKNSSQYGCFHTKQTDYVQDFADLFKAEYDSMSKAGMLEGGNIKSLDDYLRAIVNGGEFSHQMYQPFKSFLSGLLDITIVKPLIDACTGYDCITGEDLSDTERAMDVAFAVISLIPCVGLAGKAIEIGGKEGAIFFAKTVAVDALSYTAYYSAGKLGEQIGLPTEVNVLLSLGIGITATKVAGKYILKDAKGIVIGELNENPSSELPEIKTPEVELPKDTEGTLIGKWNEKATSEAFKVKTPGTEVEKNTKENVIGDWNEKASLKAFKVKTPEVRVVKNAKTDAIYSNAVKKQAPKVKVLVGTNGNAIDEWSEEFSSETASINPQEVKNTKGIVIGEFSEEPKMPEIKGPKNTKGNTIDELSKKGSSETDKETRSTTKGWKVGDPIDNLTKAGKEPSWSTVRQRYWKNEAYYNSQNYSPENIARMKKGLAPQRYNELTGKMESMELHHVIPQRSNLPGINTYDNLKPVWPDEHQLIDPFRKTGR